MNLDVCILAGGLGTRLAGIWDGPKCLVLFEGRPLIETLVNKARELKPRRIFLLLGYQASKVVAWREDCCPHQDVVPIIETMPLGTAGALRSVTPLLCPPVLVLNGDTLPNYSYDRMYAFHKVQRAVDLRGIPVVVDGTVAWNHGRYAGAAILNGSFLERLAASYETDFDGLLIGLSRYYVPGFLDFGTPLDFQRAQHLKGYP